MAVAAVASALIGGRPVTAEEVEVVYAGPGAGVAALGPDTVEELN
jgi:hypothetical protein